MGYKKAVLSGQVADIDIKLLRVFKAVVDEGGITAAEIPLNLANSTISNYLSDLEKRLDMHLCDRGRKGFSITAHGKVVYDAAQELLNALQVFRTVINDSHQQLRGEIHIVCAEHTLGAHDSFIVKVLDKFSLLAPQVNIELSIMGSDEVISAIQNDRADVGITVANQSLDSLHSIDLFDEQMLLYCAKSHPLFSIPMEQITPQLLQTYNFVESPRLLGGRELHPDAKNWKVMAKAHHQEARISLILSGHYLGFLPRHLVEQWGLQSELRPILINHYGYINRFRALSRTEFSANSAHSFNPEAPSGGVVKSFNDCLQLTY